MRNGDIIFVANAESVDAAKFLTFVNLVMSAAITTAAGIQAVPITEQVVHGHAFGAAFTNNVTIPTTTTTIPTATP
jgi:hypothetical protein